MGKRRKITYEQALEEFPGAEAAVKSASLAYTKAYDDAMAALSKCNAVVAGQGKALARARSHRDRLRAMIEMGDGAKAIIVRENVDNPMLTNGLREEGEQATRFVMADKNMAVLIGGFARIADRSEMQTLAAAKLRMLHERAQLGGARALDYGAVKVDTSGPSGDIIEVIGAKARKEYMDTVQALGLMKSSVVERVVIHDMSLRDLAIALELGDSGGARKAAKRQLIDAVNGLVDHFGLRPGAGARQRNRKWNDGSETHYSGEVANPHHPLAA